jgi:hypothetical protein
VAGCCEYGDEPACACLTELLICCYLETISSLPRLFYPAIFCSVSSSYFVTNPFRLSLYLSKYNPIWAVPWFRSLLAGLSPRRSIHVGFVVDKVSLGQVFLPSSSVFPCQYIIPPSLSKLISSGEWVIC